MHLPLLALPPFFFLSLSSVAIYPLSDFFFSQMPRPYLSILSSSSFRCHFSSSSPVAHPGVTRFFSVAWGGGEEMAKGRDSVRRSPMTRKCMQTGRASAPDGHKSFGLQNRQTYLSVTSPRRHLIDATEAWGSIPRMETIAGGVTSSSSTRNTSRKCSASKRPCGFNPPVTPCMCVTSSNSR